MNKTKNFKKNNYFKQMAEKANEIYPLSTAIAEITSCLGVLRGTNENKNLPEEFVERLLIIEVNLYSLLKDLLNRTNAPVIVSQALHETLKYLEEEK